MDFTNMSEQELLCAFAKGSPEAESEIYKQYYPYVKKVCMHYLRGRDEYDVCEVAQLIFIHLLVRKKMLQFRGAASLKCWIYTVTKNRCFAWLRQRRKERNCLVPLTDEYLEECDLPCKADVLDALHTLEQEEQNETLWQRVTILSPELQAALRLRYLLSKSYKEGAQIQGVSVSYFGVRIKRAIEKLQTHMSGSAYFEKQYSK